MNYPIYVVNTCTHALILTALIKFRGTDDVEADLQEMKLEQEQSEREPEWTFMQLLRSKELRMALILVVSLASCQQLSGINAVSTRVPRVNM